MATTAEGASSEPEQMVDAMTDRLVTDLPPGQTTPSRFLGEQFDRGLAWVHFPPGRGGLGLSPALHHQVVNRLRDAGAPLCVVRNPIGYGMVAPTLLAHGTEEHQDRYLRPLFTGEEVWCQLFSEPGAGSDVAGLAARAERDGDQWVLNGQKVWTTVAHLSRFGLLLARTDPDQPKHAGMTSFIVDMQAPGVEVRPLFQLTGEAEFNEVFFTDVRIAGDAVLGGEGQGWRVALTTLMNERVAIGGGAAPRTSGPIGEALALWRQRVTEEASDAATAADGATTGVRRDRLMRSWARQEAFRLTNLRALGAREAGSPGPEGSVSKLALAEENQRIYELCVDLMGAAGVLYGSDYPRLRSADTDLRAGGDPRQTFLRTRAASIEGGTSEVMRNILGERVLGLPGEPRADRDTAWKDVPRN